MLKKVMLIVFVFCALIYSEVSHSGLTGTNIHTVYRWQFADSAARVNQSVVAADAMKLAYQRSDSTSWILVSTTGTRWKKVAYASNQNTLTTSTMTLDSLKLTKGINATSGTFSGRITGSDVEVSDSVKAVTGSFSNLTGGYSPYQNSTGTLVNGPIRISGSNIGVGADVPTTSTTGTIYVASGLFYNSASQYTVRNAYYNMGWYGLTTGYASQLFYNGAIGRYRLFTNYADANGVYTPTERLSIDSIGSIVSTGSFTGTDLRVSDSVIGVSGAFSGALASTTVNTGNGANELYPMNQAVTTTSNVSFGKVTASDSVIGVTGTFSGALVGTTLNTGNGANELYPMNQAVTTTSNVSFDSIRTRVSVLDSARFGTGSYLKTYLDTTFYDSLYSNNIYTGTRVLAQVVKIGKIVTLYQPHTVGAHTTGNVEIRGIPIKFRPRDPITIPCLIQDSSGVVSNTMSGSILYNANMTIYRTPNEKPLVAGTFVGLKQNCFTWITY